MSTEEISIAEALVLRWIGEADAPVSPRELLLRDRPADVSPLAIRNALWDLRDRGEVRMTHERRIEATT